MTKGSSSDNYFLQGNRTLQHHQVGSAVPSPLAKRIAQALSSILTSEKTVGALTRGAAEGCH
jgi:site-specific DNA-cytosine methylase